MQTKTIKQLNQLNLDFYQQFSNSFSDSRNYYWEGWQKLIPVIEKLIRNKQVGEKLSVADVGCGNGRFASFLYETFPQIQIGYLGLDSSSHLLKIAGERRKIFESARNSWQVKNFDLVENLLAKKKNRLGSNFDLITMFGVLHHIPSFELRQKLVQSLLDQLKPNGRLVISLWRFPQFDRLKKKIVSPNVAKIEETDLEENDYILDWKKSESAYRYCHYTSLEEMKEIVEQKGIIEETFLADAKEKTANRYVIIKL